MSKIIFEKDLCTEWAEDPIELEIKLRRAEKMGWQRKGLPYKQQYHNNPIPFGWYIQPLERDKQ